MKNRFEMGKILLVHAILVFTFSFIQIPYMMKELTLFAIINLLMWYICLVWLLFNTKPCYSEVE